MNQKCHPIQNITRQQFQAWLDGAEEWHELSLHLAECEECQRAFDEKFSEMEKDLDCTTLEAFGEELGERMRQGEEPSEREEAIRFETVLRAALMNLSQHDEHAPSSFHWIMERLAQRVARVIAAVQGSGDAVGELCQSVFENVWKKRATLPQDPVKFKRLLFQEAVELAAPRKPKDREESELQENWVESAMRKILKGEKKTLADFASQVASGTWLEETMVNKQGTADTRLEEFAQAGGDMVPANEELEEMMVGKGSTTLDSSRREGSVIIDMYCFHCNAALHPGNPSREEREAIEKCHRQGRRGFFTVTCERCAMRNGIPVSPPQASGINQTLAAIEEGLSLLSPEALSQVMDALARELQKAKQIGDAH